MIKHASYFLMSLFPYKDNFTRAQMSRVVYKASCWVCQDFYIGQNIRSGLHSRKTEHFKAVISSTDDLLFTPSNVSECSLVDGVLYCSRLGFVLCLFFSLSFSLCNCVQKHLWARSKSFSI